MIILGIETSCDETSAAIVEKRENKLILKSNVVASSLGLHAKTGGIIPEYAAREQIKCILPVITEALKNADLQISDVDALAVTYGPGLIGSLLVGVETVKTFAYVLDKPIIPVNHMLGHIYANWLTPNPYLPPMQMQALQAGNLNPKFPALALIVSGGHTDLLIIEDHGKYKLLGGTRDDAAGEAFDKIGRLLGFSYPAGATIEERAKKGDPKKFIFPRPLIGSDDYDFSFSGLKTAVLREVQKIEKLNDETINDICAGFQKAIISVLIKKTLKAAKAYDVKSILLSGGVAANQTLRDAFELITNDQLPNTKIFAPQKSLCTDNGAMIAAAAAYNYLPKEWSTVTADPQLYYT